MKYLLTLFTALTFIGCGVTDNNPIDKKEPFEPYRNGTWLVTSTTEAEWVGGIKKRTIADTTFIESPKSHFVDLWHDSTHADVQFNLRFIDSTSTKSDFENPENLSYRMVWPDRYNSNSSFDTGGYVGQVNNDRTRVIFYMGYRCRPSNDPAYLQFELFDEMTNEVKKAYQLNVDGFVGTLEDIIC